MRKLSVIFIVILTSLALFACAAPENADRNIMSEETPDVNRDIIGVTPEPDIGSATPEPDIGSATPEPDYGNNPTVSQPLDGGEANENDIKKATYVRAKVDGLNVRSGSGTGYSSVGRLDKGDMLAYIGEENGYYKTYYRSKIAYVSAKPIYTELYRMDVGDGQTEDIIAVGLKLLGTPYVYGATRYHDGNGRKLSNFNINEFDCSSLMQYMFYKGADKLLDLTTRTQIKQGKKVGKADLKRGDLMFFTNSSRKNKTGIERVGHVAMYLGDNYILHTASDYAVIEEISAVRWGYFIQGNRM